MPRDSIPTDQLCMERETEFLAFFSSFFFSGVCRLLVCTSCIFVGIYMSIGQLLQLHLHIGWAIFLFIKHVGVVLFVRVGCILCCLCVQRAPSFTHGRVS